MLCPAITDHKHTGQYLWTNILVQMVSYKFHCNKIITTLNARYWLLKGNKWARKQKKKHRQHNLAPGSAVRICDVGKEHLRACSTVLLVMGVNIWQACKQAEDWWVHLCIVIIRLPGTLQLPTHTSWLEPPHRTLRDLEDFEQTQTSNHI